MAGDETFSHLVVVGASAGGIEALSELVSTLPEDFTAPIVIAQHLDPERKSRLEEILSRRSTLPVRTVADHEPLQAGVVFVVPANRHVNVTDTEVELQVDTHGRPKPSVDLLMRSAADVFGERLVAVVLTGTGSDGTEGARAVRNAGGTVIIQDPDTAEFGGMPGSLAPNTVDIVAGLDKIGPLLGELLSGSEVTEGGARQEVTGILESINDAFFALDRERRFTYVNRKAEQFWSKTRQELVGRSIWEVFPQVVGSEPYQEIERALEENAPANFEAISPVTHTWFSSRVYPSPDGVSVFFQDISERKEAEEALRESEKRLQRAIEIETVGVIFFRTDGQITDANDAFLRMSGYSREDLVKGLVRWDVMPPPEWMPHSLKAIEEFESTGRTTPYEKEYIRKDGSRWWALFAATRLGEEEGVEFLIDITERKEAEAERERLIAHELSARAQAEERRRLSRELHDRVAHDIALVHQSLELHEVLKTRDPERAAAKMELARRTVREALESTRDLSMELRQPEVRRGLEAALSDLLRDIVPPTVGCNLTVEGDETLIPPGARTQLFLILREAIRNAVAHSGADRIEVELDVGRETVVGRVEDDGRGFDPEKVLSAGSNGLQAMEERATLVGGTLGVSSAPDRGTQIKVHVPLAKEH